jgi:hypothetical protein
MDPKYPIQGCSFLFFLQSANFVEVVIISQHLILDLGVQWFTVCLTLTLLGFSKLFQVSSMKLYAHDAHFFV